MEVVSAVASFIAIGQALAAVPKVISAIRIVLGAKAELNELVVELEYLNAISDLIHQNVYLTSSSAMPGVLPENEHPLLRVLRTDLKSLIDELEVLANDCQLLSEGKGGKKMVARCKWVWGRQRLHNLCDRARRLQDKLHLVLDIFHFRSSHNHGKLLIEMHTTLVEQKASMKAVENLEEADTGLNSSNIKGGDDMPKPARPLLAVTRHQSAEHSSLTRAAAVHRCDCSCHNRQTRFQSLQSKAMSPPNIHPSFLNAGNCSCNCASRQTSQFRFQYCVPVTFWNRVFIANVHFNSIRGFGISLRQPVLLDMFDTAWAELAYSLPDQAVKFFTRRSTRLYRPTDRDTTGQTLLEYAIICYQWEAVSYFLDTYSDLLRDDESTRRTAMDCQTYLRLFRRTCTDLETYLQQRIINLCDEEVFHGPSLIHEAILHRLDVENALQMDSSCINEWDDTGLPPLHLACITADKEAFDVLMRHRADVHAKDIDGDTALHIVAGRGLIDFVAKLLDAGSDVNARDDVGRTALSRALGSSCASIDGQCIEYLISRGALPLIVDMIGRTCLHQLSWTKLSPEQLECRWNAIPKEMLASVINIVDDDGIPAIMHAVVHEESGTMVRLLVDAGARTDIFSKNGLNVLHYAARHATIPTMRSLRDARINNIDIRTTQLEEDGLKPLGELRYRIYTCGSTAWTPVTSGELISAFEDLLRGIRDRVIMAEATKLERLIVRVKENKIANVQEQLLELAKAKTDARIPLEAQTLRTINLQLKQGLFEPAIESLEEFIEVSRERMKASPFDEEPDPWDESEGEDEEVDSYDEEDEDESEEEDEESEKESEDDAEDRGTVGSSEEL